MKDAKILRRIVLALGVAGPALTADLAAAGPLGGGLGLPLGTPQSPTLPGSPLGRLGNDLPTPAIVRDLVGRPLERRALDRDPAGARIVRGEIIAIAPTGADLAAAARLDFVQAKRESLGGLGLDAVHLQIPDGMSAGEALRALRAADPAGSFDFDHIYDPSGDAEPGKPPADGEGAASGRTTVVGMIDGGVDQNHAAFRSAQIIAANVASKGDAPATVHGTAVASLLVGSDDDFHGALPGATLYAADVFGGAADGGSAVAIARALNWLAVCNVAVVNASLAGPPNALLAAAVKAFLARGHVLVAAVGNQGPAAAPAYPAAYPGVIGVTAVDADRRLELDANRAAAQFAALGVDVRAARPGHGYASYTGTSFASPIVAARFALLLPAPDRAAASRARERLGQSAQVIAPPGPGYLAPPSVASVGETTRR